jgi:lycopene cyclase domain-containing protein
MTYLGFLVVFVIIPTIILSVVRPRLTGVYSGPRPYYYLPLLAVIALAYTTLWDNYLVKTGVWWYAEGAVLGTIGYVPIEEYLFFLLQPFLSGLVFYHLIQRLGLSDGPMPERRSYAAPVLLVLVLVLGIVAIRSTSGRYLGLILVWSVPVLLGQWLIGRHVFWKLLQPTWLAIGGVSAYLWVADTIAIRNGIWTISAEFTLGLVLFGLPLEEAVFFLVTNVMVVQGLALFLEGNLFRK